MATIRTKGLGALALILGGILTLPVSAQEVRDVSPRYQGSPSADYKERGSVNASNASYPEASAGDEIQLYSRPSDAPEGAPALPESPLRRPSLSADTDMDTDVAPATPRVQPRPRPYPGVGATHAPAAEDYSDDTGPGWSPSGSLLQVRNYQGVRYVSGGIGESERAELKAMSNQFNLRMLFAMQGSGDYLANLRVRILDARGGVVLNVESDGPWFFAQLAPGTYTVEASALDQTQRQTARIGSNQSQLNFYWH
ncbi:MAG: carboxypeptidase-like regulatory domain-containing protein [Candidatus Competibacteraceae bacterium]